MTKFAIIGVGGKQFRVSEGDKIVAEKVAEASDQPIKINHVFLIADGDEVKIGTPLVEGASVEAKVLEVKKGEKVRVFKMKQRKRYHREKGHRQLEATIEILKIKG
ncbi:MAG: 50S ribosomal protein L21 [Patescibacteria group bacterium]